MRKYWRTAVVAMTVAGACAEASQPDLLSKLVGSWKVSTVTTGAGFIGSTSHTAPTVTERKGNVLTFPQRVQIDQGPFGQAVFDELRVSLEQAASSYVVSVESNNWLRLTRMPLRAQDSTLSGESVLDINGRSSPVAVTVTVQPTGGATWKFELLGADRKPMRWFEVIFTKA